MEKREVFETNDYVYFKKRHGSIGCGRVIDRAYILATSDGKITTARVGHCYATPDEVPARRLSCQQEQLPLAETKGKTFTEALRDLVKKFTGKDVE